MTRGEIWWAELLGDAGFRPVAIVSRPEGLDQRDKVTIAEVTTVIRSLPCEVLLGESDGMPRQCVINTDNLHTVPKSHLVEHILALSDEQLYELESALRYSLGLEW